MADQRLTDALARIDAAVARLQGLALAVPAPTAHDTALAERHRRLQASTAAVLARLDALIDEEG